jgi:hypothetical protein
MVFLTYRVHCTGQLTVVPVVFLIYRVHCVLAARNSEKVKFSIFCP